MYNVLSFFRVGIGRRKVVPSSTEKTGQIQGKLSQVQPLGLSLGNRRSETRLQTVVCPDGQIPEGSEEAEISEDHPPKKCHDESQIGFFAHIIVIPRFIRDHNMREHHFDASQGHKSVNYVIVMYDFKPCLGLEVLRPISIQLVFQYTQRSNAYWNVPNSSKSIEQIRSEHVHSVPKAMRHTLSFA